jgi:basic amino acid/polyamine antiporter, APA family
MKPGQTEYLARQQRSAAQRDDAHTLQRLLTAPQLIVLGIGAIVGAGIFVSTGLVAAQHTGPAIVYSFVIAGLGCLCAALSYAEFAALVPVSGSAYTYVSAAFGQGYGWMIGWCLLLEYLTAAANVAVGWSGYLGSLLGSLGLTLAPGWSSPAFVVSAAHGMTRTGAVVNLPAVAVLAALTLILSRGVRLSVRASTALVAVKLTVIALFVVFGSAYVVRANWRPFLPPNSGAFGAFGWSGVLQGAGMIFYAYLGFDTVAAAARETRNPQRAVPIGILGSLVGCTVIYIAFALVLTGLAPYRSLAAPNPISVALGYAGPRLHFLRLAVEIGAVVGLTSVVLVLLYAQSRVIYAMAQDRLVPQAFCRVDPSTRSPSVAVVVCGIVAAIAAGLFSIDVLSELISMGTLCAFVFVCAGVLYLRIARPGLERPFRVPAAPIVCVLGVAICGYLMVGLPAGTWWRFASWLAIGAAIYLLYGRRRDFR